MRPRQLGVRLLVPAVLIGLVGWLGALEYHWLDQVSQADREERRASLQSHAEEFATDFDRELSRLYVFLQNAGPTVQSGPDPEFAKRYVAWHDSARDPQIVKEIYWVRSGSDAKPASIEAYRPATRTFAPVPWPDPLLTFKPTAPTAPRDVLSAAISATSFSISRDAVNASIPAVSVQISIRSDLRQVSGFSTTTNPATGNNTWVAVTIAPDRLVAYLDRDYLKTTVLPALAARYFPPRSIDPYRLAVIDPQQPDTPIMTADWPEGTSVDAKHADASVSIFTFRGDLTAVFSQRAMLNDVGTRGPAPSSAGGGGAAITSFASPVGGGRGGGVGGAGGANVVTSGRATTQSTFRLLVEGSGAPPQISGSTVRLANSPPRWQLVLQHSAGSLDAAVSNARHRNLWLSFGLLSVLAAGVVLIVTNAQRSERLATQQMDFVATVSHELRTPLAVIRSAAQNLSAGVIGDPARAKQYGELIESEGKRLTEMVEQVLDFAGVGGSPRLAATRLLDVGAIALEVAASCEPLAADANVELETEIASGLPQVFGDDTALRSAIQNLVSNAIKYGADGHWIRIEVRADGNRVQVSVADRGLGIDPADRAHVFEPFYRGQRAKDTQIHGNGLGLSLVKRIADGLGGTVSVESTPGEGATFTLTLPAGRVRRLVATDLLKRAKSETTT
jgi:signal transduction histidine kinase